MPEKSVESDNPNPIVSLYKQQLAKKAELKRLRNEGRPFWGDEDIHRLQADIRAIEEQIKKLGAEIPIPLDPESEELRRRLLEIAEGSEEEEKK